MNRLIVASSTALGAAVLTLTNLNWNDVSESAAPPPQTQPPTAPPPMINKYGLPTPSHMIRSTSGYVASVDFRTRNPQWVAQHLTKANLSGANSREKETFVEDHLVPEMFRSRLEDYRNSGFDRGHMMPAADAKDSAQKMTDTFFLTNISPQVGVGFNRDYWARLENFVRQLVHHYDDVYCITGPAWLPKKEGNKYIVTYEVIGNPPNVSVPTHFFKVILAVKGKEAVMGAFMLPNEAIPDNIPLDKFVFPVDWVEKSTGHIFFPFFPGKHTLPALCSKHKCILPAPWTPKPPKQISA